MEHVSSNSSSCCDVLPLKHGQAHWERVDGGQVQLLGGCEYHGTYGLWSAVIMWFIKSVRWFF